VRAICGFTPPLPAATQCSGIDDDCGSSDCADQDEQKVLADFN
jgi:hypothetical protein